MLKDASLIFKTILNFYILTMSYLKRFLIIHPHPLFLLSSTKDMESYIHTNISTKMNNLKFGIIQMSINRKIHKPKFSSTFFDIKIKMFGYTFRSCIPVIPCISAWTLGNVPFPFIQQRQFSPNDLNIVT